MPLSLQDTARAQIKRWTMSTGISQKMFGERIGRDQVWVSKYLNAQLDTDIETLQQMAQVFGHTLTQLLDFPADPDEAAVITAYRAIRQEIRPLVVRMLQEMGRGRGPKPRAARRSRS
jgi:transcriptional regulator with XRE-family HTH domain